nr:shikimate dehydrogenase [Legionellales bacterium]
MPNTDPTLAATVDHYAVIGNPIEHSLSPQIHQAFAQQTKQSLQYTKIQTHAEKFESVVRQFFADGGKGMNVTVPFKEQAFQLCDALTPRAQSAGAVNTLWQSSTHDLVGDNTDGVGLINDLRQHHLTPSQQHILLIGAGGAARGVLPALLANQPATLVITNRTLAKVQPLIEHLPSSQRLTVCAMDELDAFTFDLIINTTSCSLQHTIPPIPNACYHHSVCYDLVYQAMPTVFLQHAKQHGARQTLDGFGM